MTQLVYTQSSIDKFDSQTVTLTGLTGVKVKLHAMTSQTSKYYPIRKVSCMDAEDIMSLEDKIFAHVSEEPYFTMAHIEALFPDEHPRALYRAIDKLEDTQRIRFVRQMGRRKAYTTVGISQLPMLKTKDGDIYPLSDLLQSMPHLYGGDGHFKQLDEVNDVLILMMQLFVIAQEDDPNERKRQSTQIFKHLVDMRQTFLRFAANIDAVIKHPSMQGDPEIFKRVFASKVDKSVPSPEELIKFRRWLATIKPDLT